MRYIIFLTLLPALFYGQALDPRKLFIADLHEDVLESYFSSGRDIEHYSPGGHVDLDRLRKGGVDAAFFVIWPNPDKKTSMFKQAVTILDTLDALMRRNEERTGLALTPEQILALKEEGKTAIIPALESGTALDNQLENIDYFYRRGIRYWGITWNDSPDWASSAQDESNPAWRGHRGLNDFGRKVIRRLNELGIMVDLSHSGEQTFYDVLRISTKPVIASHSSVYALCPHFRNLKDAQLKALAQNGGVVFINFYPGYLVKDFNRVYQAARKRADVIQDSLKTLGREAYNAFDRSAFILEKVKPLYPDYKTVVDHIDYVVKLIGVDHVGIGSDFDGISLTPYGLRDVSKMPVIIRELERRGYAAPDIEKIMGGNLLRVMAAQNR